MRRLLPADVNIQKVVDMCALLNRTHASSVVHLNLHPKNIFVGSSSLAFRGGVYAPTGSVVTSTDSSKFLFRHPLLRDNNSNVRALPAMDYYSLFASLYHVKFGTVPFYIDREHVSHLQPDMGPFLANYIYECAVKSSCS